MSKYDYTKDSDQKLVLAIEQLEVCADLIKSNNPAKARMAIILLDNLVDILMGRYCHSKIRFDEFAMTFMPPKFTEQEVQYADKSIQGKLELLKRKIGGLTKKDETIITICHSYRNSAQHRDEHNPGTTIVFAKILFGTVCKFFVRLQSSGHSAYYHDKVPSWAGKYISGKHIEYLPFAKKVVSVLGKGLTVNLVKLKASLLKDIQERVKKLDAMIAHDLPNLTEKQLDFVLKMYQYQETSEFKERSKKLYGLRYRIHDDSISREEYKLKTGTLEKEDWKARQNFIPSVRMSTLRKIRNFEKLLGKAKDVSEAIRTYERFNLPLEKIEGYIIQGAEEWDEWIQLQIDIARGK